MSDASTPEEMALGAEDRAMLAPTQEERDNWLRIASDWWEQAGSQDEDEFRPEEDDGYIQDVRDGYSVSYNGSHVGTYSRYSRAAAALYLAMVRSGYYPNVWHENDHGNMTLCVFNGHVLTYTDTAYV